jgi:hypothetical protein
LLLATNMHKYLDTGCLAVTAIAAITLSGCQTREDSSDEPFASKEEAITYVRPSLATQKTYALPTWENVSLLVPPNKASCGSNGAFLISIANGPRVVKYSAACTVSSGSSCTAVSDVSYGTTNWPAVSQSGFIDAPTAASDQQIVRFANGDLLLMHQGVRRDANTSIACTSAGSTCRGVEYLFRSQDCGASWSFLSILDAKTDGPPGHSSRYYRTTGQGGHDRPELYVDPFNTSRVYATMMGQGNTVTATVLYRSDDRGKTWQFAGEIPLGTPASMTTVSAGSSAGALYIAGWYGSGSEPGTNKMGIARYNPATGGVTGPYEAGDLLKRHPLRLGTGSEGIARINTDSFDRDSFKVHYTFKQTNGDVGLAQHSLMYNPTTDVLSFQKSGYYSAPVGNSVVGATVIQPDGLENSALRQMYYWYEVKTTSSGSDYGPARTMYTYSSGNAASPGSGVQCLSWGSSGCRTWPLVRENVYGDYQKGAFGYWNNTMQFVGLWAEVASTSSSSVSTNVLGIVP